MKWWLKCISMVIAKIASRNVAFKAAYSTFERQSDNLMTEAATVKSPSLEDLDDMLLNRTRFKVVVFINVQNM